MAVLKERCNGAAHLETSDPSRLANGCNCPEYLFPGFCRYGTDEGDESCSNVNEQIRIPG